MPISKPVSVPRWGDVSGLIVVPPSGKQDIGWLPGERPPAQYENWLHNLHCQWESYVNALLTTGGGATDNLDTSGNGHFGGTFSAGGLITASAGLTAAANQHVTVSGSGLFKHGTKTLVIPLFAPGSVVSSTAGSTHINLTSGNMIQCGIPLRIGERITAVRASVTDSATGPTTLQLLLVQAGAGSAAPTTIATSSTSAGNGTDQTLSITGQTLVMATGKECWALVKFVAGTATCFVHEIEVDYDQP